MRYLALIFLIELILIFIELKMNTDQLVDQILTRKLNNYEHEDFEVEQKKMTWDEWNNWEPGDDDIPSLVESIKFWSIEALPKGNKSTWNKLQREIANECYKKELICYELLGKSMRKSLFTKGDGEVRKAQRLQKRKQLKRNKASKR
jgi:hypothetical protein